MSKYYSSSIAFGAKQTKTEKIVVSPTKIGDVTTDAVSGALTVDEVPTLDSLNPVSSGGVKEAISEAVADIPSIEAVIPEGASEENQLVKSSDLNAVDGRLENVESKIPSSASSTDKLVTKSELDNAIDNATASMESGYTPKGTASVSALNALTDQENGDQYIVTDSGTLTEGSLSVTAGESVAWDSTNEIWYKVNQYALNRFGTNEVHDLAQTASESDLVSLNYILVDTPEGPKKLDAETLLQATAQNTLAGNVAPEFDATKPNGDDGYAYHAGEKVVHDSALYQFLANKTSGAWNASVVKRVTATDADGLATRLAASSRIVGKLIRTNGDLHDSENYSVTYYDVSGEGIYRIQTDMKWAVQPVYAIIGIIDTDNVFKPIAVADITKNAYCLYLNTIGLSAAKIVVSSFVGYWPIVERVNYSEKQTKDYIAGAIASVDFTTKTCGYATNAGVKALSIGKNYNSNTHTGDDQFGGTYARDTTGLVVLRANLTSFAGTSQKFRIEIDNPDYADGKPYVTQLVFSRDGGWAPANVISRPLTSYQLKQKIVRYEFDLADVVLESGQEIWLVWGSDGNYTGTNKITYKFYGLAGGLVYADRLQGHPASDYYTKSEIDSKLPVTKVIDCVGDSLIAGGTWEAELIALLGSGWTYRNLGIGGQNVGTILGRVNVFPWLVGADVTVPATVTPVEITLTNLNGGYILPCLNNGRGDTHLVVIAGVEGTLSTTQTDPAAMSATYYFTRSVAGNAVAIKAYTPIQVKNYKIGGTTASDKVKATDKGHFKIYWFGQNGGCGQNDATRYAGSWCASDDNFERYVAYVKMCRDILGDKMLVLSPTQNTNSTYENKLAKIFGQAYINVRKRLMNDGLRIAYECGYIESPTPSADDAQDIADGKIPRTLMSDTVHLNTAGYKTLAHILYNVIQVVWNVG